MQSSGICYKQAEMSGSSVSASAPMHAATTVPSEQAQPARSGVVVVYSHRDRDLLGELQVHLKPLQKAWLLDLWDDLRVAEGSSGRELRRTLEGARVVVLMISPGFFASPFITDHHLPALLASQPSPRAEVLCLYARPAMDAFVEYEFPDPSSGELRSVRVTGFYGLNDPMKPLAAMDKRARREVLEAAGEEILKAAHRAPFAGR